MKTTKLIDIWKCDLCGNEINYNPNKCSKCGKEICSACMIYHDFNVLTSKGFGKYIIQEYTQCKYNVLYCNNCATELKDKLEVLGFKEFTTKVDTFTITEDSQLKKR